MSKKIRLELTEEQFMRLYQEAEEGSYLRLILDSKLDSIVHRQLAIEEHNKKEGLRRWT